MKILKFENLGGEIPLLFENDASLPAIKFRLVFRASGAICAKNGVANLVCQMLDNGTASLKKAEFASLLETRAINLQAFCGTETFGFEILCLKEHFLYALDMLLKLVDEPNFSDEILAKVKDEICAEILDLSSDFDEVANDNLNKIAFANTPMAFNLRGEMADVENIALSDVCEFWAGLNLANAYVFLGGDIGENDEKFRQKIAQILAKFKFGVARNLPKFTSKSDLFTHQKVQSEQAFIYFCAPFCVDDDELFIAKTAMFILGGGGFGSRLMEEVRVRAGLAYSCYATAKFSHATRMLKGYLQTKNENAKDALNLVKKVINDFCENGATQDELDAAKAFLAGSNPLRKETAFAKMAICESEFYDGKEFGFGDKELEKIQNLDLQKLNNFIKNHDEISKLCVAIVSANDDENL